MGMFISNEVSLRAPLHAPKLFPAKFWYIKQLIYIDQVSFEDEGQIFTHIWSKLNKA